MLPAYPVCRHGVFRRLGLVRRFAQKRGVNIIGLQRAGFGAEEITEVVTDAIASCRPNLIEIIVGVE